MIGINSYVLCFLRRCEVTPIHRFDTIDRTDTCDISGLIMIIIIIIITLFI